MPERLLILNPGSTSTKAAVYDGTRPLFSRSIPHSNQDLAPFPTLNDQLDYRVALVRGLLAQERVDLSTLTAVVGRGGILPNIVAGGYQVNDALVDCLLHYPVFEHASNLGGVMALAFARPLGIPAYIYDAATSCCPRPGSPASRGSPAPASAMCSTPGPPPTSTPRAGGWPIRT